MADLGSVSEFRLSAQTALKLPDRFRDRTSALLIAGDGRIADGRLREPPVTFPAKL